MDIQDGISQDEEIIDSSVDEMLPIEAYVRLQSFAEESQPGRTHLGKPEREKTLSGQAEANELSGDEVKVPIDYSDIKGAFLKSACFLALEFGHHEVVREFLKKGVNPNLKNFQGQTLLHRATRRKLQQTVDDILGTIGVEINERDQNGRTALMANADIGREKGMLVRTEKCCDVTLY